MTPERLAELAAKFPEVAKQFNPKGPIYEDALLRAEKASLPAAVVPEPVATPVQEPVMPAVIEEPIVLAAPVEAPATTPAPLTAVDPRFATPLAGALTLAAMGIPQIPVSKGLKKTFLKDWPNLATTDAARIKRWAEETPGCNFASVAKAEIGGFWFLELDENGLAKRIADEGKHPLPNTLLVRSRQGRGHLYFRQNVASITMGNITQPQVKGAGFSVRVNNEYVVCPGSYRLDLNRFYEPVVVTDVVEAPQWLIDWIESQRIPKEKMAEVQRDENNKIPFGQIHDLLVQEAGRLAARGYSLESRENALLDWSLDNCAVHDEEHVREVARSTKNWKTGDPRPGILFDGNVTQKTAAVEAAGELSTLQQEYDEAAEKAEQEQAIEQNPYPIHIWEGTPYYEFAVLAHGEGETANFIPLEYFVNTLMTVTGAICGHRIFPTFSPDMPAHFFTVLLSVAGGAGKNEAMQWAKSCYKNTGLLFQVGLQTCSNIGAMHTDFGSARGLIEKFMEYPSILGEYGEITTAVEKFGIKGSGTSFLDFLLNSYDKMEPNWSVIKGMKLPANLPERINNSFLAASTDRRWDDSMASRSFETFIQRLNIVDTAEIRTVFELWTPEVSEIRKKLMSRVGLLEEYKLIWNYSGDARRIGKEWHDSLLERIRKSLDNSEADIDESEIYGRIQVFAHRIVGHLALWLAPLPTGPDGQPTRPNWMEGTAETRVKRAESQDKEWRVEITGGMMSKAIEAAEYLLRVRSRVMPTESHDARARIENLIKKWAVRLKYCRWPELKRRANLRKYSSKDADQCLFNIARTGALKIKKDPSAPEDQRNWVVVWDGDGKKTKKWTENRGKAPSIFKVMGESPE